MMAESVWKIPYTQPDSRALEQAGFPPLLAALLASRGVTSPADARRIVSTEYSSLYDPLLMLGMEQVRARIMQAVSSGEKVTVYGDYDVDGITSTCLLTDYLRSLGVDCGWYIPDRNSEGYGLNKAALKKLRDEGNTLIVTVDCGITAIEEAVYAREIGLDLVITDHHECRDGQVPDACAVIDPKRPDDTYPNSELAGVGVAFKLVCACSGNTRAMLEKYADLVAVGTIADVMPLLEENRCLVRCGLRKLAEDPRSGFYAIMNEPGCTPKKPTASFISYTLAPRLNAAGRLGKTDRAEMLMLSEDAVEAAALAAELRDLNRQRQQVESEIWQDVHQRLKGATPDTPVVLAAEGWHQGVIGIVASRIADRYGVPAVMISLDGEEGKGSCRSCRGFNIYAALAACADELEGFGGHMLAAGLNIRRDRIEAFREKLASYYLAHLPEPQPDVECDLLICDSSLLSLENVRALDHLEPYGSANPSPVFCISGVRLVNAYGVGPEKQHLKFSVELDGMRFGGIFFSHTKEALGIAAGDLVDVAFTPQINEYMGTCSVQLAACAMRPHHPESLCERILENDRSALWAAVPFTPSRDDFVMLWRRFGTALSVESCLDSVLSCCPPEMAPERYCLCLAVFSEAGLLQSESGDIYSSSYEKCNGKVNLDATEIMRILRGRN